MLLVVDVYNLFFFLSQKTHLHFFPHRSYLSTPFFPILLSCTIQILEHAVNELRPQKLAYIFFPPAFRSG